MLVGSVTITLPNAVTVVFTAPSPSLPLPSLPFTAPIVQLDSIDAAERINACVAIAGLLQAGSEAELDAKVAKLVEGGAPKKLLVRLVDAEPRVRVHALGACKNIAISGGDEAVDALLSGDAITVTIRAVEEALRVGSGAPAAATTAAVGIAAEGLGLLSLLCEAKEAAVATMIAGAAPGCQLLFRVLRAGTDAAAAAAAPVALAPRVRHAAIGLLLTLSDRNLQLARMLRGNPAAMSMLLSMCAFNSSIGGAATEHHLTAAHALAVLASLITAAPRGTFKGPEAHTTVSTVAQGLASCLPHASPASWHPVESLKPVLAAFQAARGAYLAVRGTHGAVQAEKAAARGSRGGAAAAASAAAAADDEDAAIAAAAAAPPEPAAPESPAAATHRAAVAAAREAREAYQTARRVWFHGLRGACTALETTANLLAGAAEVTSRYAAAVKAGRGGAYDEAGEDEEDVEEEEEGDMDDGEGEDDEEDAAAAEAAAAAAAAAAAGATTTSALPAPAEALAAVSAAAAAPDAVFTTRAVCMAAVGGLEAAGVFASVTALLPATVGLLLLTAPHSGAAAAPAAAPAAGDALVASLPPRLRAAVGIGLLGLLERLSGCLVNHAALVEALAEVRGSAAAAWAASGIPKLWGEARDAAVALMQTLMQFPAGAAAAGTPAPLWYAPAGPAHAAAAAALAGCEGGAASGASAARDIAASLPAVDAAIDAAAGEDAEAAEAAVAPAIAAALADVGSARSSSALGGASTTGTSSGTRSDPLGLAYGDEGLADYACSTVLSSSFGGHYSRSLGAVSAPPAVPEGSDATLAAVAAALAASGLPAVAGVCRALCVPGLLLALLHLARAARAGIPPSASAGAAPGAPLTLPPVLPLSAPDFQLAAHVAAKGVLHGEGLAGAARASSALLWAAPGLVDTDCDGKLHATRLLGTLGAPVHPSAFLVDTPTHRAVCQALAGVVTSAGDDPVSLLTVTEAANVLMDVYGDEDHDASFAADATLGVCMTAERMLGTWLERARALAAMGGAASWLPDAALRAHIKEVRGNMKRFIKYKQLHVKA